MKTPRSLLYFNLVKLLDTYQISNTELAEMLYMAPSTFSNKMMGKTDWKFKEMLEIQKYIKEKTKENITLDYLFEKE